MHKLWADKLMALGKVTIHSNNCKWIKVEEYWNKWAVTTCWHDEWLFDSPQEALNKVQTIMHTNNISGGEKSGDT